MFKVDLMSIKEVSGKLGELSKNFSVHLICEEQEEKKYRWESGAVKIGQHREALRMNTFENCYLQPQNVKYS